jgi:hypothetical protein
MNLFLALSPLFLRFVIVSISFKYQFLIAE